MAPVSGGVTGRRIVACLVVLAALAIPAPALAAVKVSKVSVSGATASTGGVDRVVVTLKNSKKKKKAKASVKLVGQMAGAAKVTLAGPVKVTVKAGKKLSVELWVRWPAKAGSIKVSGCVGSKCKSTTLTLKSTIAVAAHPSVGTTTAGVPIGQAGGTVQATGPDGTKYRLVFPPKSLPWTVAVTLTPVTSMPGLGGLHFVGGVIIGPNEIPLGNHATLTVTPAHTTSLARSIGLYWEWYGHPVSRAFPGMAKGTVEVSTGGGWALATLPATGTGRAPSASARRLTPDLPTEPGLPCDDPRMQKLRSDAATIVGAERQAQLLGQESANVSAQLVSLLEQAWGIVEPVLANPSAYGFGRDDTDDLIALHECALGIVRQAQLLGAPDFFVSKLTAVVTEEGPKLQEELVTVTQAILANLETWGTDALHECQTSHSPVDVIRALRDYVGYLRENELLGGNDIANLDACMPTFQLDIDASTSWNAGIGAGGMSASSANFKISVMLTAVQQAGGGSGEQVIDGQTLSLIGNVDAVTYQGQSFTFSPDGCSYQWTGFEPPVAGSDPVTFQIPVGEFTGPKDTVDAGEYPGEPNPQNNPTGVLTAALDDTADFTVTCPPADPFTEGDPANTISTLGWILTLGTGGIASPTGTTIPADGTAGDFSYVNTTIPDLSTGSGSGTATVTANP
jgi:hypothetical protein